MFDSWPRRNFFPFFFFVFSFFLNHIFYVIIGLFPFLNTAAPLQLHEVLHSDLRTLAYTCDLTCDLCSVPVTLN